MRLAVAKHTMCCASLLSLAVSAITPAAAVPLTAVVRLDLVLGAAGLTLGAKRRRSSHIPVGRK
jgi:hypothetical protein